MKLNPQTLLYFSLIFFLAECKQAEHGTVEHIKKVTSEIDDSRLVNADNTPGDWLSYGKNYAEDRYSTLEQINKDNVKNLGLAWSFSIGTTHFGMETTPVVVDGIMYFTGPWSKVYAVNAKTGQMIWTYDPKVPGRYGIKPCCDVVNRGVALYKGKVYVGTIDGRLVSIDASTGTLVWEIMTVDTTKPYSITGAPRVVNGKVIIGNGGAEMGVRGYITAYDALTGKQVWRFFTVPGDPSKPFESEAMKMAAKTWTGTWWEYGGGGTVWDAMAYDPTLNLLYIGTGNGSPWSRFHRSPGGGDNLFLASIIAINPDNGEMVWYYQTTPGETWDFTATQHLLLADLMIKGQMQKVIMQAPKNGIFYVLNRTNGKLISAKPYTFINWATGIDSISGRPIETNFSRFINENAEIFPGPFGAHNWQPMAFNQKTKLVYLPVRDLMKTYGTDPGWKYNQRSKGLASGIGWNTAIGYDSSKPLRKETNAPKIGERLVAWDPVNQKEIWNVPYKSIWNGGVLTTSTGLIFEGSSDGNFRAFDASNGKILWEKDLGTGIIASPITYQVADTQYISIAVGWGGAFGKHHKFTEFINPGTVYTFALHKNQPMPVFEKMAPKKLIDLPFTATPQQIKQGSLLFQQYCESCHSIGTGGGSVPDLGYSSEAIHKIFKDILLKGSLTNSGMPNFSGKLSEEEVTLIQNYILATARNQMAKQ